MEYQLFRCTECSNLCAGYTRPKKCHACGDSGGFQNGSAFERIEREYLK